MMYLTLRVRHRRDDLIGVARVHVGQKVVADPGARIAHHGVGQRPEQVAPGDHLADVRLHAAEVLGAGRLGRLQQQAGDEVELDREPRAAVDDEARQESGAREEVVGLLDVGVDEDVLPGHQHLVHDEDRVVLVEPRRQRVVERAAHDGGGHLVRGPADQLRAGRVGRQHEDQREVLVLQRDQAVVGDEGVVGQRRAGRDHLGAGDDQAGVGLALDVAADVGDLVRRPVAIDRRVDDRVVDERHALLAEAVPAPARCPGRVVEVGVGAERREERRLVVGRAAHPAVGDPRPFGDRVGGPAIKSARRLRRLEEGVRQAAAAGVGRQQDLARALRIVERIEQARGHARGVAERRVRGDVLDPLAVDVDLAPVAQRIQILGGGHRRFASYVADGFRTTGEFDLVFGGGEVHAHLHRSICEQLLV